MTLTPIPIYSTSIQFERAYAELADSILQSSPNPRGEVHAQKTVTLDLVTREISSVIFGLHTPLSVELLQRQVRPNLPWAEDHFQERVSGEPFNPPPSNEWWPFNRRKNADHKDDGGKFSHTYPERFWPEFAGRPKHTFSLEQARQSGIGRRGIRFRYGDLNDLLQVLSKNPATRQAYLPVWFPEDLAAATQNERVPCTLGYHFIKNGEGDQLDATYFMRSCDLVRFFRDDVYMAARLLQWVAQNVDMSPGVLTVHIVNLHAFVGDDAFLNEVITTSRSSWDEILLRSL